jgi:hypothetical protein
MTVSGTGNEPHDLIKEHRRRVADLRMLKVRVERGEPVDTAFSAAIDREKTARETVLRLSPLDPETTKFRLLHLLACALAVQLRFTDEELALLRQTSVAADGLPDKGNE